VDVTLDPAILAGFAKTAGAPIQCQAAVAWGAKQPLSNETIIVGVPRAGEIRCKVMSNALCHTDLYTLDGHDPEVGHD
jgi:Zn-dependent alcohol dehydrogenase